MIVEIKAFLSNKIAGHFSVINQKNSVCLSFVKLFSVVSVVFQCSWTFQCDFQCHSLIVKFLLKIIIVPTRMTSHFNQIDNDLEALYSRVDFIIL